MSEIHRKVGQTAFGLNAVSIPRGQPIHGKGMPQIVDTRLVSVFGLDSGAADHTMKQFFGGGVAITAFVVPKHGRFRIKRGDRKSTRLNSSHQITSYAVFCLKKKKNKNRK